jgi:hypothetical protein
MADAYRAIWFRGLPADFVFAGRALREKVGHYRQIGVIKKIIAGPEACNILIDVREPYTKPVWAKILGIGYGA